MKGMWLVLALATPLLGADVSGAWSGKIVVTDPTSGEKIDTLVQAQFDQKDATISGKIGRAHDQELEQIRNAKLEGNTFVFEVQPPEATSPMKFSLVIVSDNRIEGDMNGAIESGNISGKVTLERAPAPR